MRWLRGRRPPVDLALLALLAYLPALTAAPGRMPADTKLYLYLDPGRLISDATATFDGRQFAGWVPHQTISYLWPSGPWFWVFEQVGVPDWVAHRLWIATILFVAGAGVRWLARTFGIGGMAAFAAAAVYQCSPYVLPYLSRTSLMLLPYAGLGWIVGLTVRATQTRWRHAALLALVIATVAAPNATAIAMIAPAPVLWLLHAAWGREITWRRAGAVVARVGVLGVGVSLWWLAMLVVQGRYGADVLAYSETLEAVSLTSTSVETLRGMGYWLFYVRDPIGFTTSAAEAYMISGRLVATSVLITALGLAGLAATKFAARRFAVLLVVVGTVLAVGVHPIDDPSLLMSPFAESSRSTLVLALRSSTRALPMSVLGLALGAGALTATVARALSARRSELRAVPALAVGALALVNLPAATNGGFVDSVLSRDQDPPDAWLEAVEALDAMADGTRVMQLPGAEFGAFRWGYTVDPPLPGLTDKPFVSRDLLPLGSPPAMDLLYALDDRFQDGTVEPDAIAPVARLLGVDTIWVPNDIWFDRFRSPRPGITASVFRGAAGLGQPVTFGEPFVPEPVQLPVVDERSVGDPRADDPLEPVWLVPVEAPVEIIRAKTDVVAVAGSGDGIVDAAAAGLIDGTELIVYTGALPERAAPQRLVVTDSNRDQARQWRGSHDTRGFTEDGGADPGVLTFDSADQRLDVFGPDAVGDTPEARTVALQEGPVTAAASAYGEPFGYRPETRAAMAIDGDPGTAWTVADRVAAAGQFIELTADQAIDALEVVQPSTGSTGLAPNRWITEVDVSVDGAPPVRVTLDESSRTPDGQQVVLPAAATTVRVTIVATERIEGTPDGLVAAGPDAVGFAEIRTGLGATDEFVRPPVDWGDDIDPGLPTDVVVTRLRASATDRWRSDPEPSLRRRVDLPGDVSRTATAEVRLAPRAADQVIADLLGADTAVASERLTGTPTAGGWAAVDGDPDTAWITPFGRPVGPTLTVPNTADVVGALAIRQPDGTFSTITEVTVVGAGGASRTVALPPADADGWSRAMFEPMPVDGAVEIRISGAAIDTTRDRRSAELVALPAAIAELHVPGATAETLPATLPAGCYDGLLEIDGAAVAVEIPATKMAELMAGRAVTASVGCDGAPSTLSPGDHRLESIPGNQTGLDVDRVVIADPRRVEPTGTVSVEVDERDRTSRTVTVDACPDGCWIVLGEGRNDGWEATVEGRDLGPGELVDGGFNGWWLEPSDTARTVELRWTPQRTVTIGVWLSALAVLACIVLALIDRGRGRHELAAEPRWATGGRAIPQARWPAPLVTGGVALLVAGPGWALLGLLAGFLAAMWGRTRLLAWSAVAVWLVIGFVVAWRVTQERPFPDAAWPGRFEDLHRPGMFVLALLAGSLVSRRQRDANTHATPQDDPLEHQPGQRSPSNSTSSS